MQTRKEREIQQQMMAQDDETVELRETFTSLQQEVEAKTKKLKKVNASPASTLPAAVLPEAGWGWGGPELQPLRSG